MNISAWTDNPEPFLIGYLKFLPSQRWVWTLGHRLEKERNR